MAEFWSPKPAIKVRILVSPPSSEEEKPWRSRGSSRLCQGLRRASPLCINKNTALAFGLGGKVMDYNFFRSIILYISYIIHVRSIFQILNSRYNTGVCRIP